MSVQGYWADLKAPAFRKLPSDLVAVLPVGAIEQHGPHLPVSVDRDLVEAVVARCLVRLDSAQNVLVLPTLAITKSGEHDRHPGTLSLTAETLLANLRDIGASVARAGVSRLVLFNAHGGNNAVLDIAARDLRMAHDMIVATCSWFGFADYDGVIDDAARPEQVDMRKAKNFVTAMQGWEEANRFTGLTGQPARPAWIIDDLNADGACGDASAATAEKGERLLDSAAGNFARFLAEFARFDHRKGGA